METNLETMSEIQTIQPEQLMELVVDITGMDQNTIGDTAILYEDERWMYQMCYLSMQDNQMPETRPFNSLATLLMGDPEGKKIHGRVLILRSEIGADHTCKQDSVTLDNISELVRWRLLHRGVKIRTDGSLEPVEFKTDPVENETDPKNWAVTDISFFGLTVMIFLQLVPDETNLNHYASTLLGSRMVDGDVIIAHPVANNKYGDLGVEDVRLLLKAGAGPIASRQLTEEEGKRGEMAENGLPKVHNGYRNLRSRCKFPIEEREPMYPKDMGTINNWMRERMKPSE